MHRKPGGLVDHQHQSVAVEHARLDLVGGQFNGVHRASRLSGARLRLQDFGSKTLVCKTFVYGAKRLTQPPHEPQYGPKPQPEPVAGVNQGVEADLELAWDAVCSPG